MVIFRATSGAAAFVLDAISGHVARRGALIVVITAAAHILSDVRTVAVRDVVYRRANGPRRDRAAIVVFRITDPTLTPDAEVQFNWRCARRAQEVWGDRKRIITTLDVSGAFLAPGLGDNAPLKWS